jgi:glyoxylase-like metal-dependent hydrolase (beta-lactamase superfamily II)
LNFALSEVRVLSESSLEGPTLFFSSAVLLTGWLKVVMKLFPHTYQIRSLIGDRNLFQYLFVGDNMVLLDTGASNTPNETILPFLRDHGLEPSRLTMAINTHADADHHGGNASLKESAGDIMLGCGERDREIIENPNRLFDTRYNQWIPEHGIGLGLNAEASIWVRSMVGPAHRIDLTFCGGEHIAIDDKRSLRVLHVPGHSDGHLAIYDPVNRAVFVGDSLHGRYCPAADGAASLPPAYYSVLAYLGTIQFLEALDIEWIYSGHWPAFHGSQVSEFLAECRRFVDSASSLVWRALERHEEGVTLSLCIEECGPALGKWPASNRWLLMYPMHGHLLYLEQQGLVKRVSGDGYTRWKLTS